MTSMIKRLASFLLDTLTPDFSGCLSHLTEEEILSDLHYGRDEKTPCSKSTRSLTAFEITSKDTRGAS